MIADVVVGVERTHERHERLAHPLGFATTRRRAQLDGHASTDERRRDRRKRIEVHGGSPLDTRKHRGGEGGDACLLDALLHHLVQCIVDVFVDAQQVLTFVKVRHDVRRQYLRGNKPN